MVLKAPICCCDLLPPFVNLVVTRLRDTQERRIFLHHRFPSLRQASVPFVASGETKHAEAYLGSSRLLLEGKVRLPPPLRTSPFQNSEESSSLICLDLAAALSERSSLICLGLAFSFWEQSSLGFFDLQFAAPACGSATPAAPAGCRFALPEASAVVGFESAGLRLEPRQQASQSPLAKKQQALPSVVRRGTED